MKADLSILIPARNEMFLKQTIDNILKQMRGNTEVIAVCDGNWPDPPIEDNEKVVLIYNPDPIGQRAATNKAARYSRAEFIMKCDAHCSFDEGFDVKLMSDCPYEWTVVPRMYNLHAFDWVCRKCGNRRYQGPTPVSCPKCDNKTDFYRDILWKEKHNPTSDHFRFDKELHFQYWNEFKKRPEAQGDLAPTMSLLGACWMMHRQRFWDLDGCDEMHGSWGQMGTEIACKSWLSGGALMVNKKTWFSHMFRTQGGDFGFPYPNPGIKKARSRSRDLWYGNSWPKAKHSLSWLLEKFSPVPEWDVIPKVSEKRAEVSMESPVEPVKSDVTKGLVYYTDNRLDSKIFTTVQKRLMECTNGFPITCVSLMPTNFGSNYVFPGERGYLTMFRQILMGLENIETDVVFLVEHDVLYHPCHFEFIPPKKDVFYYNENRWFVHVKTGHALFYNAMSTSGLCAYRDLLIEHYRKRVERVEKEGFTYKLGFEPGNHPYPRGVDLYKRDKWFSQYPNLDLRGHGKNLTPERWSKDQFRNKGNLHAWEEGEVWDIPGWSEKELSVIWKRIDGITRGDQQEKVNPPLQAG